MSEEFKETIKENIDLILNGGATVIGELLSETIVGQIAPGVITTYISYKQKKSEKMILNAIGEIRQRIDTIESALKGFTKEQNLLIKEVILPIVLDSIVEETQEEKISLMINGLQNIIEFKLADEDMIILYYDILKSLRILDIKFLLKLKQNAKDDCDDTERAAYESNPVDMNDSVYNHIINKLQSKNLVKVDVTWNDFDNTESRIHDSRINITLLGNSFIDFFKIKEVI